MKTRTTSALEQAVRLSPVVALRGLTTGIEPLYATVGAAWSR